MDVTEFVIWGTGLDAEKFYYQYYNKINISHCVDNFNYGSKWHGLEIMKPDSLIGKKYKILVATSAYYNDIKQQLSEMGFIEYRDFDYCFHVNKKIVFINGNCHCRVIKRYLETSKKFSAHYAFGDFPLVFEKKDYDENSLKYCDLYIHQDIRKDNSIGYKYSDEYIIPRLKKECIKCCIPNLYGFPKALFYTNHEVNIKGSNIGKIDNPFFYREAIIDSCIEQNYSFQDICEKLKGEFIIEKEITEQFKHDQRRLLSREEGWDIKISDYLYENYQSVQ